MWTFRRSDQIAACLTGLEHKYVAAVDDDSEPRFSSLVSERAHALKEIVKQGGGPS
ncbi:hypothetical protein ACIQXD_35090 [Streptomyces uncialis]|uniref:hypothetical protein n=1 Tax=Streptomyces uncialis TaxID=1048205 RepID=UPI0037F3D0E8